MSELTTTPRFSHCEFGHLVIPKRFLGMTYFAHVHEQEAYSCAYFEDMGWPRP